MARTGHHLTEDQKEKIRQAQLALHRGKPRFDQPRARVPKPEAVPTTAPTAIAPEVPITPQRTSQALTQPTFSSMTEVSGEVLSREPSFEEGIARYHLDKDSDLYKAEEKVYGMLREMEKLRFKVDVKGMAQKRLQVVAEMETQRISFESQAGVKGEDGTSQFDIENETDIIRWMDSQHIPIKKMTKLGKPSITQDVLRPMVKDFPMLEPLVKYTGLKMVKRNIDSLDAAVDSNGTIGTHYTQFKTATGRVSTDDFNLIGLNKNVREFIQADDGKTFIYADQKQFEYRIFAALAGEKKIMDMFNEGVDVHRRSMAEIMKVPEAQVTDDMRNLGKVLGYSVLFGGCIEEQAPVLTSKGFQRIMDVKVGDTSIDGEVTLFKKWVTDKGVEIKVESLPPVKYTPDHPIQVVRPNRCNHEGENRPCWKFSRKKYKACRDGSCPLFSDVQPIWIPANQVRVGDYVMVDLSLKAELPTFGGNPINEALVALCSRYTADGHVCFTKKSDGSKYPSSIVLTFGNKTIGDLPKYEMYVDFLSLKYSLAHRDDCTQIIINSRVLAEWIYTHFNHLAHAKVIPAWVLGLPLDLVKVFLQEYSDGSQYHHRTKDVRVWSSCNKNIILMLCFLHFKLGHAGTLSLHKLSTSSYPGTKYRIWNLMIPKDSFSRLKSDSRYAYLRVYRVDPVEEPFTVCNLTTQSHLIHTPYITHNTGYGIALSLGIPEAQGEMFLNKYYESFPNMKKFSVMIRNLASQTKEVVTYFGRKHELEDNDFVKERLSRTLRQAVNYVAQGAGADILKLTLAQTKDPLEQMGIKIVMPAHDAIMFECDDNPEAIEKAKTKIKELMQNEIAGVKLEVDVKSGKTFKVMK